MAARSPEPANRCARPHSFSALAAGCRRASMSAKISIAAESRAEGVMSFDGGAPSLRFLLFAPDGGETASGRRIVTAHALAQFLYRFGQVADVKALRRFAGPHAFEHAAQQIVILLVAVGLEIEVLRYLG